MESVAESPRMGVEAFAGNRFRVDIASAAERHGCRLETLPYSVRVLLENVERHRLLGEPGLVGEDDVRAIVQRHAYRDRGVPLHVTRVILPDSSGVPALQDLAALRDCVAERGGDPRAVDTRVPVDLIVDHSLQVDRAGHPDAVDFNLMREFGRNGERYRFLKWAQQAFRGLRIFPPGTGIIHQINLEFVASVVARVDHGGIVCDCPDFVIGGDSHTPMVNAIGVLGWGVGGIDAEAAILGQPYVFPIPEVVGVELAGRPAPGVMTTDIALLITQRLRKEGVTGCFVEYFGEGIDRLTVPERATIANMAPEYGATCGFFAIDSVTLAYLDLTRGSSADVTAYAQANGFFRNPAAPPPVFDRVIRIDLAEARAVMAGPKRPQDRLTLGNIKSDLRARLGRPLKDGGFAAEPLAEASDGLQHGSVVLAAITSCTNTSNPQVMLAAGLIARRAVELGMTVPWHVKTSLAPGSRAVTRYLDHAELLAPLEKLGFGLVGYGCTTCGGKSGPLDPAVVEAISSRKLVVAAVLSGNRNFEGRIHKEVQANYIGSPPLVVLYALAGRMDIDLETDPIGRAADGRPIHLRDLWPDMAEIAAIEREVINAGLFRDTYGNLKKVSQWEALEAPTGPRFAWDPGSTYLVPPPFFSGGGTVGDRIEGARALGIFGDSLTTDHISPGGEILEKSPAGKYLVQAGVKPADFNTYVGRRGNHEVMTRATFANLRIKNLLVPDSEGWFSRGPDGEVETFFDAARLHRERSIPTLILAGREYGTGSSRDWAAKGTALLGISAVIAESFERIHRANLIGMGVLPLLFAAGEGWRQLGLTGDETFRLDGILAGVRQGLPIQVEAEKDGRVVRFSVTAATLTESERRMVVSGGIFPLILEQLAPKRQA